MRAGRSADRQPAQAEVPGTPRCESQSPGNAVLLAALERMPEDRLREAPECIPGETYRERADEQLSVPVIGERRERSAAVFESSLVQDGYLEGDRADQHVQAALRHQTPAGESTRRLTFCGLAHLLFRFPHHRRQYGRTSPPNGAHRYA